MGKALMVAWCWVLMALPASAGTLYRCISPGGQTSYQSMPCGAGQRLDRTVEYQPESPAKVAKPYKRPRSGRRPFAYRQRRQGVGRNASTDGDRCRAAKAQRANRLERLGLSRNYDRLSRMDEVVKAVCRGY